MKYFSMFSGIGGFELGIQKSYNKAGYGEQKIVQDRIIGDPLCKGVKELKQDEVSQRPQLDCVGYSEVDKFAIQVYQEKFSTHKNHGDATRIVPEGIPDFEFLCGGFPCQAFSIAGKRGGFQDTRGTLFFEIARILSIKRPKLLLLENVKGLLSHDNGRTFGTILATLSELGYICQWQILNSKDFGVPQNRERVFIVGHLGVDSFRKVFPLHETNPKNLKYLGAVMSENNQKWLDDGKELSRNFPQGQRIFDADGIGSTLCGNAGGLGGKTGLYAVPLKFLERNQKKFQGEYCFTLDSMNTEGILKDSRVRRLTPTECERLQGFPDGWTAGLSDSQRYKCLGNAVTVNVIEAIMDDLIMEFQKGLHG